MKIVIKINKPGNGNLLTTVLKPAVIRSTQSSFKELPLSDIKASLCSKPANGGFEQKVNKTSSPGKISEGKQTAHNGKRPVYSYKRWQLVWARFLRSWHVKVDKVLQRKPDSKTTKHFLSYQ